MDNRTSLIELFRSRALRFGDFTLSSGKKASYYLDGKQVTLHSLGLRQVSLGLWGVIRDLPVTAVGGMSLGADPIVAGVLTVAAEEGRELTGFVVRKEPKSHGTQRYIEGPLRPGERVAIVEDVVTTGGSSLQAIERVREFGAEVVEVLAIVDRMEGAAAAFRERNIPFRSLLTIADFGIAPPA